MNASQSETEQLEKGWNTILIIWIAMFVSLGAYLGLCHLIEIQVIPFKIDISLPIKTINILKTVFYGVSLSVFVGVHLLRRYLLNSGKAVTLKSIRISKNQHPAIIRYSKITSITLALVESIGIYGLVLFLLSRDVTALYQLIALSAVGMIYFRPRKNELMAMADEMRE